MAVMMEKLKTEMQQLQKDITELRSEMNEFCSTVVSTLSAKTEKLFDRFKECADKQDVLGSDMAKKFKQNQDAFIDMRNKLTEKFEAHVNDASSFKAQVVKHQVATRTDGINMQKEMKKVKEQLDVMRGKHTKEHQAANQLKEQLASLNKKLLNEQQATAKLRVQVDAMDGKFTAFGERLKHLQLEIQEKKTEIGTLQPPSLHATPAQFIPEWVLRERKRNNIIIFGLHETGDDHALIKSLFNDLDIPFGTVPDTRGTYRVGSQNSDNKRPIVIKLAHSNKKNEILLKARNLKGNTKWQGVVITHDLTKMECQEERARELQLRRDADEKNMKLSVVEKQSKTWKVIGGRGERRVALLPM